jgi:hypothetical protein
MKIGDPVYRGNEVSLPAEILDSIIWELAADHELLSQAALWSCCLVSKSWYAATISFLYRHPVLNTRNFDEFVRVICPSVSARKSRAGLEDLVKILDMSSLAYSSSKSVTARLLSRTRKSIESFSSPAVTFS